MFCGGCNSRIENPNAKFCSSCGKKVDAPQEQQRPAFCGKCGAKRENPNAKFCPKCGNAYKNATKDFVKKQSTHSNESKRSNDTEISKFIGDPVQAVREIIQKFNLVRQDKCYPFFQMDREKLKKAIIAYGGISIFDHQIAVEESKVLFLVDNTVFGGADDGLFITWDGIYVKELFTEPKYVPYSEIQNINWDGKTQLNVNGEKLVDLHLLSKDTVRNLCEALLQIVDVMLNVDKSNYESRPTADASSSHRDVIQSEDTTASLEGVFDKKRIIELITNFGIATYNSCFVYPNIPESKLKNAITSYGGFSFRYEGRVLNPNDVLFLIDSTIFGSAEEGLFVTSRGIYSKVFMQDGSYIPYDQVRSFEIVEDTRLHINNKWACSLNGFKPEAVFKVVDLLYSLSSIKDLNKKIQIYFNGQLFREQSLGGEISQKLILWDDFQTHNSFVNRELSKNPFMEKFEYFKESLPKSVTQAINPQSNESEILLYVSLLLATNLIALAFSANKIAMEEGKNNFARYLAKEDQTFALLILYHELLKYWIYDNNKDHEDIDYMLEILGATYCLIFHIEDMNEYYERFKEGGKISFTKVRGNRCSIDIEVWPTQLLMGLQEESNMMVANLKSESDFIKKFCNNYPYLALEELDKIATKVQNL